MTNNNDSRKAFEEWFFGNDFKAEHRSGNSYHLMSAYSAWNAWQAAQQHFLKMLENELDPHRISAIKAKLGVV